MVTLRVFHKSVRGCVHLLYSAYGYHNTMFLFLSFTCSYFCDTILLLTSYLPKYVTKDEVKLLD